MTGEQALIGGRYRLQGEVGRGAMGVVWQARDERLDRVVAVKQLSRDTAMAAAADGPPTTRAEREAQLAARLRHPHVVLVYDVVDEDDTLYLIMEYLPSRSLADVLAERGSLPADEVAVIGSQLASALAAAHEAEIVHRDVTPANVLVTPTGVVKIADFGIARAQGQSAITGGGIIAGTPAYLAPEVANGGVAGAPADVFSLGATLYHALEGTPPFGTDDNPIAVLIRAAQDEVVPPRHTGPLADVLVRMLHREPAGRPVMTEVQDLLGAVLDDRALPPLEPAAVTPRPATRMIRIRLPKRRPAMTGVAGVAGVALVVLGVLIGIAIRPGSTPVAALLPPRGSATSAPAAPPPGDCTARYAVTDSWSAGYQVLVTVQNTGRTGIAGWQVSWTLPAGQHIQQVWNGLLSTQDGPAVTVANADWNARVDAVSSTTFGLIAVKPATASPGQPILTCQILAAPR
ncbi:MAG TPA: protein kinase [Pseudonocardiaceae bacterium]|nr:protein kinase [Pseudonocardiaceae bacterium]